MDFSDANIRFFLDNSKFCNRFLLNDNKKQLTIYQKASPNLGEAIENITIEYIQFFNISILIFHL